MKELSSPRADAHLWLVRRRDDPFNAIVVRKQTAFAAAQAAGIGGLSECEVIEGTDDLVTVPASAAPVMVRWMV